MAENTLVGLQSVTNSIRAIDSSRQLALGLAIGTLIGFLPKDNLIFIGLLVFLIISGANLLSGGIAFLIASLAAPQLQETFHYAGSKILETEFASRVVPEFLALPMAAWTDINNTVVCGSLFVGLALLVPIYLMSYTILRRYRNFFRSVLYESRIGKWLTGTHPPDALESA